MVISLFVSIRNRALFLIFVVWRTGASDGIVRLKQRFMDKAIFDNAEKSTIYSVFF